jgi:hypothetical protein
VAAGHDILLLGYAWSYLSAISSFIFLCRGQRRQVSGEHASTRVCACVCLAAGLYEQSWEADVKELESRLARSEAAWKLVIGHHPIVSTGHHGDQDELVSAVDPLLRKYGVQVGV